MAANIEYSVDNSNLFTLTNNEGSIAFQLYRATCQGNTITYVTTDSSELNLASGTLTSGQSTTYSFIEDGLYKLTIIQSSTDYDYYVRVTGNTEACRRSLEKDFICKFTDDCSILEQNKIIKTLLLFTSYRTFLYGLLNKYQQSQSTDVLLSIPDADKLTICQYFCMLSDICGSCLNSSSYNVNLSDCGCSK